MGREWRQRPQQQHQRLRLRLGIGATEPATALDNALLAPVTSSRDR